MTRQGVRVWFKSLSIVEQSIVLADLVSEHSYYVTAETMGHEKAVELLDRSRRPRRKSK